MKKITTNKNSASRVTGWLLCTLVLLGFTTTNLNAQCSGGTLIGNIVPTAAYQTLTTPTGTPYYTFYANAGATYNFTYCGNGGSAAFDTQITILDNAGAYAGGYSDDFCGLQSNLTWTCATAGVYRVLINRYSCLATLATTVLAYNMSLPNDACAGAIGIANPSTTAGSTAGAATDVTPCNTFSSSGMWYSVVGDGSQYTASLCGTSYDSWISVYTGTCGALVCVGQNDDFCGLQSQISFCTTSGTTYFILVNGFSANSGVFSLALSKTALPTIATATGTPSPICLGASTNLNATGGFNSNGFAGFYAPGSWTQVNGGGGSYNTAGAPASISITSGDVGVGGATDFNRGILSATDATLVTFSWSYTTTDGAGFDYPQYLLNGVATIMPGYDVNGGGAQSGTASITVPAGQTFGLEMYTVDGIFGAATTTFSNFVATDVTGTLNWYNVPTAGSSLGASAQGADFAVTPTVAGVNNYYVEITNALGCATSPRTLVAVTVNALPVVTASAAPASLCIGGSTTLTGGGAVSYTWTGGVTDGVSFNPASTLTYTVTGTDANTCVNTATQTVTVNSLPTVTANASAATVCSGSAETLTGGGASTYTWTGGVANGVVFNPTATLTYTVTGTDANTCVNTASVTVNVNALPTVTANASANTVCSGGAETLTGGGATSYTWTGGVTDGVVFNPTSTVTYTVTGTDANTCINTATVTVNVNALPTVTANASAAAICNGGSETLTGGGATSYAWTGGVTDGTSFNPASTATYTVTGTDANTCVNTATVTVTVNALPTVTANASAATICSGDAETLTGGGATSYAWTGGVTDGTSFNPSATATYTVTGTDANTCVNTATVTVTVNALPTVTANASAMTVCMGDMETLTGGGATSYTWDNGVTDAVAFATTATTTYMVTGTDGNGCSAMAMVTVTVNSLPTVTANASAIAICAGDMETLTGGGATSYTWDNSVSDGVAFAPASTTTYNVMGTDGNGCMNSASVMVTVNTLPTVTYTETMVMACVNWAAYALAAGSPASGVYSGTGVTGSSFDPAAAGVGTATVTYTYTDGNGCMGSANSDIVVDACTGIAANSTASVISVYPNPSNGVYFINVDKATRVTIFNTLGAVVFDKEMTSSNNEIDLSSLANGMYSLKATEGNNQQIIKLVKN